MKLSTFFSIAFAIPASVCGYILLYNSHQDELAKELACKADTACVAKRAADSEAYAKANEERANLARNRAAYRVMLMDSCNKMPTDAGVKGCREDAEAVIKS